MPPFDIDPEAIRKLAELMTETGLSEIELAEGDRKLRVSRAVAAAASPAVHFTAAAAFRATTILARVPFSPLITLITRCCRAAGV